ncbi:hypothetical protein B0T19DRAFT_267800 [Cercophora scortea]|uniref:Uncharacterized protein n=1 Tax=Cercophora scortea TaxID=314031 RepID=A0AAE0M860_9PEZI|nr:hypothetical protein B0T19DRAFT_267800 [Cercophora scortea]
MAEMEAASPSPSPSPIEDDDKSHGASTTRSDTEMQSPQIHPDQELLGQQQQQEQPEPAMAPFSAPTPTPFRETVTEIQAEAQADPSEEPSGPPEPHPPAFPKKRRGRPPGRPNMTVREADYEENALVQAWNAAKSERATTVVSINIREALTESLLVHDTQRAIFRLPSREIIHFVQGWITARHVASQRPSYVNGLLIHSRGEDSPVSCAQCTERRAKNALGPFLTCRALPGSYHNSCSNCKWFDNTSACSLYTGPKPNRKRKAKEITDQENTAVAAAAAGEDVARAADMDDGMATPSLYEPQDVSGQNGQQNHMMGDGNGSEPSLQPDAESQVDGMHAELPSEAHYKLEQQEEADSNAIDAQLAAQLLPEIQRE